MRTAWIAGLLAVSVVSTQRVAAQVGGDPVTVQFGSYLGPNAGHSISPFGVSYNFPAHPDHETFVYEAALFQAVVGRAKLEIRSMSFFAYYVQPAVTGSSNVYNVFFSTVGTGQGLQSFGSFGGSHQCVFGDLTCSPYCGPASDTCKPPRARTAGIYQYDPSLGDLRVDFIETFDIAMGEELYVDHSRPCQAAFTTCLVTRFDGIIATPEPSTFLLITTGFLGALVARRIAMRVAAQQSI